MTPSKGGETLARSADLIPQFPHAPHSKGTRPFPGWWIVLGSFVIYFAGGGVFYSATVFLKAISEDLGWTRGEVSAAFSIGALVTGLSAPFWGWIADRHGPRAAFLPGVLLTGGLTVLLSRISSIGALYACYLVMMVGSAGISLIPVSVIISNWFVEKRGRAMGIAYTGVGFGSLALTPLIAWLIDREGWREAYLYVGLGILVVLLPVVALLRDNPHKLGLLPDGRTPENNRAHTLDETPKPPGLPLSAVLHTRVFWLTALTWFVVLIPLSAVSLHQVPYMTDLGLDTQDAAWIAGTAGGMSILGRVGFGYLTDRFAIRFVFCGCYLMLTIGIVLLWAAAWIGTHVLFGYSVIFGIAVGGSYAMAPLLVGHLFGVRDLGKIFGVLGLPAMLGAALGPALVGHLFDRLGNYNGALALCVGLGALGSALVPWIRAPRSDP